MRNIDIDLIRAFQTVYETGSFSHAADRLGRTQSAISQQIRKLEELLGNDVFIRTKGSITLTSEGEILLPYARQIITLNDEAFGRISKPDISGTIRLGAPEAFAQNHLPEVLVQFTHSHPSVRLEVDCDVSPNLVERFEKGDFDLILFKRDDKIKVYGNKVWKEPLVWIGQKNYEYKKTDIVPLILSPSPCIFRNKMTTAMDKKKIKWSPVFTSASITGRIAAAKAGLGITAVPKEMLSHINGVMSLEHSKALPPLSDIEIDMLQNEETMSDAARRLAEHLIFALENNPTITKMN